ncbi:hypothetical protein [Variovorax sp. J22R115]|uniref:hypothetical protein n=1 Tax=Variovorax sp. J22R115 TaxID=3053509 RepID=UPI002577D33B|nr:hypothetical protein [Variovorax sp. J22R115]MDM0050397.1 hypothetical protein [Variovorax sp. J22R115]
MADYRDNSTLTPRDPRIAAAQSENLAAGSAVSWGAIFAGAVGAASLSLILLLLGTGLGLSSISPWASEGATAATIGVATILWLTFTQIAASGMGGYLAGRLRTKWAGVQTDEVYFRDTAHGFLAWGAATIITAALLTSAIGSILGAGAQAGASAVTGAATAATAAGAASAAGSGAASGAGGGPINYFIDSLFRKESGSAATAGAAPAVGSVNSPERGTGAASSEVTRIFMNSIRSGALPPADSTYVAQLVSQQTGLSPQDAEKRVSEIYAKAQAALNEAAAKAKAAADSARKASAYGSLWLFISLLIGAFVASYAATYGGHRRDL